MKRTQNILLFLAVILLTALPLWLINPPAPDAQGNVVGFFAGADDQAKDLIGEIAPDYQPWFKPLMEPASSEIASLLFALQAALGAGFIGYYLGVMVTRDKFAKRARAEQNQTSADLAMPTHAD